MLAVFTGFLHLYCDGESYDFFSSPILSLRSDPRGFEYRVASVQLAFRRWLPKRPTKAVMKNLYEVLRSKEEEVCQLRQETQALRFLIGLLDREDAADASPANPPNGSSTVYLLTKSGRLELIVRDAPRLRFSGEMRMPMEILRIGNEFHIFVPTPQPISSGLLEEGAA